MAIRTFGIARWAVVVAGFLLFRLFDLASQVIDVKGREVGRYYTQNRLPVAFDSLNPHLVNALVATEDSRFFSHSGVDVKALMRVMMGIVTFDRNKGGGSTLTQQLAKLLFDRPDFTGMGKLKRNWTLMLTKFKEWIEASILASS